MAVELIDVVSAPNGFPLLAGVDLRVDVGEVVLISGPNGAGKTSLLRLIAGLIPVSSGAASVLGSDIRRNRRVYRRRVAFVAQDTFCYEELTVRRNLGMHARAAGRGIGAVEPVMTRLGIDHLAGVEHSKLSTGQRRRCAIAVGLVRSADLLLLDEPHAGLDAAGRHDLDSILGALRAEGSTVMIVSHELERLRPVVDREIQMCAGYVKLI